VRAGLGVTPGRHGYEGYGPHLELEADVCVVGAGAGGASLACAVAEAGHSVVVVEEGRHWKPSDFKPAAPWAFQHLYHGRGTRAARGNAIIPIPGGRGVGGSTLINSAICFRTPDPVLADWRSRGLRNLEPEWMAATFDRIWRTIGVTVNPPEVQRNNNHLMKAGAEALGLKGAWLARSAPGCTGCGTCQQGCPTGGKLSVDRTFLAEAVGTGRVGVYADCRAEAVETEGGRVVALTGYTQEPKGYTDAGTWRVRAKHFVLAAGAIQTPRFLLRNGLGAGPVGEHLHIHPTSGVLARFRDEVLPWHGVTQGYYVDCWERGFLLQTFCAPPDQYYVSLPLPGDEALAIMADLRYYASGGVVVHDEDSTGRVGASSLGYWLGDGDRRVLMDGLRTMARLYFAAGATEIIAGAHGVGVVRDPADIDRLLTDSIPAHDLGLYAAHPMGTCRMGGSPEDAVVDPDGRVWGMDNLWISDASVFPTSLGVNPQVTIMALGLTTGRQLAAAV